MQYVAFLRAINVGGRRVKMEVLRGVFERFGFADVATILASGNVLFDSPSPPVAGDLEVRFESEVGFSSTMFIRSAAEVRSVLANRPWDHADAIVDVVFLSLPLDDSRSAELEASVSPPEAVSVIGTEVFILRAARDRQTPYKESDALGALSRDSTRRGIATVERVAAMFDSRAPGGG